jgi:hypothetical protein
MFTFWQNTKWHKLMPDPVFQNQEWTDKGLVWNTSKYNVQRIRIPASDIWMPDIVFNKV